MTYENIKILLFCENYTDSGDIIKTYNLSSNAAWLSSMLLDLEQFQVIQVDQFLDSIYALQTQAIDVVILNLSLHNAEDVKIVSSVSKCVAGCCETSLASHVPIVVINNLDNKILHLQALNMGAQDYLVKSETTSAVLRQKLLYIIEQQRRQNRGQKVSVKKYQATSARHFPYLYNKTRWRWVSEATFEGIMLHDNGMIVDANQNLAKMTGYKLSELIGKNSFELVTVESQELIKKNILSGSEISDEVIVVRKDGSTFPVELQGKVISYQGQQMQVVAVRDITERKQAQEALQIRETARRKQSQTLVQLARSKTFQHGNLNEAFREITEAAARTLLVQRVGIWLYNQDHTSLKCIDLYDIKTKEHTCGTSLLKANYPDYFQALEHERSIAAHDAINDERTQELSQSYLAVLGITSVLDAPIWLGGRLVGVVSHEHFAQMRQWTLEEENFAGSIADFVTLAMEASERNAAQEALRQSEAQFRACRRGLRSLP